VRLLAKRIQRLERFYREDNGLSFEFPELQFLAGFPLRWPNPDDAPSIARAIHLRLRKRWERFDAVREASKTNESATDQ